MSSVICCDRMRSPAARWNNRFRLLSEQGNRTMESLTTWRTTLAAKKLDERPEAVEELEIVRPDRARPSAEEALKRMEEFPEKRKEKLVAAVRKGKG